MAERRRVTSTEPEVPKSSREDFVARDGDRLTVTYRGAKLQIAAYSTVELDDLIYSRTLLPGEDPDTEFDRVYEFLRQKAEARAREKLAAYADALAKAKERARGPHG